MYLESIQTKYKIVGSLQVGVLSRSNFCNLLTNLSFDPKYKFLTLSWKLKQVTDKEQ